MEWGEGGGGGGKGWRVGGNEMRVLGLFPCARVFVNRCLSHFTWF